MFGCIACSLCIHLIAFDVVLGAPAGKMAAIPPTRLRFLAGHLLAIRLLSVTVVVDCVSCPPCVCVVNLICLSMRGLDHFTPEMLDSMNSWWKHECSFLEDAHQY